MKVTLSKIHSINGQGQSGIHPSLVKLGAYAEEVFPIKRRYRLGRVMDGVLSEIKIIEKHRNELVAKYADGEKQVPDDKVDAFFAEFNELLEVEIELPDMSIALDELGDKAPLNAIDLMALSWIIAGEDEPEAEAGKANAATGD